MPCFWYTDHLFDGIRIAADPQCLLLRKGFRQTKRQQVVPCGPHLRPSPRLLYPDERGVPPHPRLLDLEERDIGECSAFLNLEHTSPTPDIPVRSSSTRITGLRKDTGLLYPLTSISSDLLVPSCGTVTSSVTEFIKSALIA